MVKAVIFDLDGTLADTLETLAFYSNKALASEGLPALPAQRYRYLVGRGARVLMQSMLAEFDICDDARASRMLDVFQSLYMQDTLYLTKLYPGIEGLISNLNKHGIACGVVSNKPDEATQDVIKQLFPNGGFGFVTGKRPVWALKPAPDSVLAAAQALNAAPEDCLYIGDTCTDMLTGKAAGMFTVGVLWGFRDYDELHDNGADAIVQNPDDILKIALS